MLEDFKKAMYILFGNWKPQTFENLEEDKKIEIKRYLQKIRSTNNISIFMKYMNELADVMEDSKDNNIRFTASQIRLISSTVYNMRNLNPEQIKDDLEDRVYRRKDVD